MSIPTAIRGFSGVGQFRRAAPGPQSEYRLLRAGPGSGGDPGADPFEFRVLGKPPAPQPRGQTTPWGITRVGGGAGVAPKTTGAVAFVIDTGIDLTHPDLNTTSAAAREFRRRVKLRRTTFTAMARMLPERSRAKDNTIGVIGVVPGAKVVAVRVLDRRGSGSNSDVIAGVDYVADVGKAGDVANMSLGGGVSQALDDAVIAAVERGQVRAGRGQ